MSTASEWKASDYEKAAAEYLRGLPLEHFMEATSQSMQREITIESLALLKTRRPEVQYFNELLVQYWHEDELRQVVPDNMVILSTQPSRARGVFDLPLEAVGPFLVIEYVSVGTKRKDYVESFGKYERQLQVPYCMMFYPEKQDLRMHHHNGEIYERLEPDAAGRIAIPELDVQVGLLNSWVRFWYCGELLELPAELDGRLQESIRELAESAKQLASKDQQLASKDQQLASKDQQLASKDQQLAEQTSALQALVESLRSQVEGRARKAGRQEILEQLKNTRDLGQLMSWLNELP